jgi:hypothetical protein
MLTFQTIKNVEKEPLVYGLVPNFFYLFIIFLFVGVLITAVSFISLLQGNGVGTFSLFVSLWITSLIIIYRVGRKKSQQDKYKFHKKRVTHSNKDLYKYL